MKFPEERLYPFTGVDCVGDTWGVNKLSYPPKAGKPTNRYSSLASQAAHTEDECFGGVHDGIFPNWVTTPSPPCTELLSVPVCLW